MQLQNIVNKKIQQFEIVACMVSYFQETMHIKAIPFNLYGHVLIF